MYTIDNKIIYNTMKKSVVKMAVACAKAENKNLRSEQTLIRVSKETFTKIQLLAKELGYAQITTLEYLLKGKIDLDKLR